MRMHVPIGLRWSDLDAYAHVNNAEMLRLLEEARIQAFWTTGDPLGGAPGEAGGDHETGTDAPTAVFDGRPGSGTLSLIARQEIEYLLPIPYLRQPLDIELWLGRIGGASLEVCYEVYSPQGVLPRVLFTRAATTLVLVDEASGRPRRVSGAERTAWAPFVEEPVRFRAR
jgi:acyl-CoA thioester hydrolase